MSKRSRRQYPDDDGRVVANMNVEGMPGYRPDRTGDDASGPPPPPPTRRETRSLMTNAVLAALLIGAVFLLAAGLLILFCTNVWLK